MPVPPGMFSESHPSQLPRIVRESYGTHDVALVNRPCQAEFGGNLYISFFMVLSSFVRCHSSTWLGLGGHLGRYHRPAWAYLGSVFDPGGRLRLYNGLRLVDWLSYRVQHKHEKHLKL